MVQDKILTNQWHVVARSQDIPSGKILTTRLLGENVVLWRCGDKILAGEDRCPHRGASFAQGWVKEDNLICPYHCFAYNTSGQCVQVPAQPDKPPSELSKASFPTYHVQERYELIWVCMGTPSQDIPALPEWEDSSYRRIFFGPFHYKASGLRAIENVFDFSHIPYIHEGTLSKPENAAINNDFTVKITADGIDVKGVEVKAFDLEKREEVPVIADYLISRPLTVCLRSRDSDNHCMTAFFTATPVEEEKSIIWRWTFFNYAHQVPEGEMLGMGNQIMHQDIAIVNTQRPKRLPLDLQAEFHADTLLDQIHPRGEMDLISEFALPLPVMVICALLGVEPEDFPLFRQWSIALLDASASRLTPRPEIYARAEQATRSFIDYFTQVIAARRTEPRQDLITALVKARDEGDKLSDEEVLATCIHLLTAGHETTVNLIGKGTLALLRNPHELKMLQAHSELIPGAVEELLRYDSPVQLITRWAYADVEIGGNLIQRGDSVGLMLGAANRDPARFENPDVLDLQREDCRHCVFGSGIHFCLGSALARAEGQIAFKVLLKRLGDLRLVDQKLEWGSTLVFHGPKHLRVAFKAPSPAV